MATDTDDRNGLALDLLLSSVRGRRLPAGRHATAAVAEALALADAFLAATPPASEGKRTAPVLSEGRIELVERRGRWTYDCYFDETWVCGGGNYEDRDKALQMARSRLTVESWRGFHQQREARPDFDGWLRSSEVVREDGTFDADKARLELSDYYMLLDFVPKVYMAISGGRLSKPNYLPAVMISVFEEEVTRLCQEAVEEAREEWKAEQSDAPPPGSPLALIDEIDRIFPAEPGRARELLAELRRGVELLEVGDEPRSCEGCGCVPCAGVGPCPGRMTAPAVASSASDPHSPGPCPDCRQDCASWVALGESCKRSAAVAPPADPTDDVRF